MKTKHKKLVTTALCLAGLGLSTGCDDDKLESQDDPQHERDGSVRVPDASAGNQADAEAGNQAVYAIATQVFGANDQTSYLVIREGDLFAAPLQLSGAERAGRALTVASLEANTLFYAGDKTADVDRYEVKGGKATKIDSVSFAGQGVTAVAEYPGQLVVVSETKALYFDARTLKVIVWNPNDMTLSKAIDVSGLKLDGFSATFSTATVRKGDKVYMPVAYRTPAAVPSNSAMLVVDTANDSANIVKETRCGYVRDIVEGADGKLYVATEAFGSAVNHLNGTAAPKPCLLRFDPAQEKFDDSFNVDLNALTGATTGSLVKLPNGKVYTRTLDPSKAGTAPNGRTLASAIAWNWAEITLEDAPKITPVADGYVMGGSLVPMPLGDKLVIPDFASDQSKTVLCDMSDGPRCANKVEVKGLVFSVAKLH